MILDVRTSGLAVFQTSPKGNSVKFLNQVGGMITPLRLVTVLVSAARLIFVADCLSQFSQPCILSRRMDRSTGSPTECLRHLAAPPTTSNPQPPLSGSRRCFT